jgi:hypothetical protein
VDLEYPLKDKFEIPKDIKQSIKDNTEALKAIALKYGSEYIKIKNVGVSQNWSAVAQCVKLTEDDVLIGVCPDEMIDDKCGGWISAMGEILMHNTLYGYASLIMKEQFAELNENNSYNKTVNGINIIEINGNLMIPILGLSGRFYKEMGGVPHPNGVAIYGGIEQSLWEYANKLNYKWCMMKDYIVKHPTDIDNDLYRQWKNDLIFGNYKGQKQIQFTEWLELKSKA